MDLQELDALREICVPLNTLLHNYACGYVFTCIIYMSVVVILESATVPCVCMVGFKVSTLYGIQCSSHGLCI